MRLRTYLTAAAVLTASLLALQFGTAQADGTGGPIAGVLVNGNPVAANVAIDGVLDSATFTSYDSSTPTCTSATFSGTVRRGANAGAHFSLAGLSVTCGTTTLSMLSPCTNTTMTDSHVHYGLVDDGTAGSDPDPVTGTTCLRATLPLGCTYVISSVNAQFKETPKVISGVTYQELVLSASSRPVTNQSAACFGLLYGVVSTNITFNVRVSTNSVVVAGTPPTGAIDFYN